MDTGYIVVINIIYKKIPHLSQKQSSIIKHSWKKNPQKNCCLKYKFVHANIAHKGVGYFFTLHNHLQGLIKYFKDKNTFNEKSPQKYAYRS